MMYIDESGWSIYICCKFINIYVLLMFYDANKFSSMVGQLSCCVKIGEHTNSTNMVARLSEVLLFLLLLLLVLLL